jgi:PPOX class probable F420-dependent enzyme
VTSLPSPAKAWLDLPVFVSLATINADGSPHSTVHWVARDGDDVLLSTVRGRLAARNVERDPRVSVLLIGPDNPYSYLEVRGTATVTEQGGRELIDDLAEKYRGVRPYSWDKPENVRLLVRVPPEHVVMRG